MSDSAVVPDTAQPIRRSKRVSHTRRHNDVTRCNGNDMPPYGPRNTQRIAVRMQKATHGTAPSTGSCRRSAWSTLPPLCSDQSSAGAVRETVYRRRPGLLSRRTNHLEQRAGQRDICPVSVDFRQRLKTFLFQASFPDIIIDPR